MTYRRDSNVFNGYGNILPLSDEAVKASEEGRWLPFEPNNHNYISTIDSKRYKEIGWMVSHCQTDSKRETVVKELQAISNLSIDIFGNM